MSIDNSKTSCSGKVICSQVSLWEKETSCDLWMHQTQAGDDMSPLLCQTLLGPSLGPHLPLLLPCFLPLLPSVSSTNLITNQPSIGTLCLEKAITMMVLFSHGARYCSKRFTCTSLSDPYGHLWSTLSPRFTDEWTKAHRKEETFLNSTWL